MFGAVVVLQLLDLFPVETYTHTALGMIPFVLAIGFAVTRFDCGIVPPVARDEAIEDLSDLFLVLDGENRLVDFNPAAATFFEGLADDRIGEPLEDVVPGLAEQLDGASDDATETTEVPFESGEQTSYFDLRQSSTEDARGETQGTQLLLRDITTRKEQEREISARERELDMLKQVFSRVFRHNVRNELTVASHGASQTAGVMVTGLLQ